MCDIDFDLIDDMDRNIQKPVKYLYLYWGCTPYTFHIPTRQKFWRRVADYLPWFIQDIIEDKYPLLTKPTYDIRQGDVHRKVLLEVPGPGKYFIRLVYYERDLQMNSYIPSIDVDIDIVSYRRNQITNEYVEYVEVPGIEVDILELGWEDEIDDMLKPLPYFKKQLRTRIIEGLLYGGC